jgi:TolB-like protein
MKQSFEPRERIGLIPLTSVIVSIVRRVTMAEPAQHIERKLAAIFAADVAGYSRLMGQDEVGTMRTLTAYREVIDRLIGQHRGRIANTAGDSVLAEFPSVVDALQCAVEVQKELGEANDGVPDDRRMSFRIGIHVGDVMVRGGDLLGDGVNIAARLQALAEPGGLCLSGVAYEYVKQSALVQFRDLGPQTVKNIGHSIRAYASANEGAADAIEANPPAVPDKPSIAVLPFANMSGDVEQEYFADGLVEDLITGLSRFKSLLVIARNSSFTYKSRAVDVKQVGRELGVRYVLEGSVRKAATRVRIAAQLIEAESGVHVWAERYEGSLEDIFAVQDELTASLLGALGGQLEKAEIARAKRKRPTNLDAYDLFLRALATMRTYTPEGLEEALRLYHSAIEADPEFAAAYAGAAMCYVIRKLRNWMVNREWEVAETARLARRAVLLGGDDGLALCYAGQALANVVGELDAGARASERALTINPNFAPALVTSAFVNIWEGKPDLALERLTRAVRLSPRDPSMHFFHAAMAHAHFHAERYEEAIPWALKSIEATNDIDGIRVLAAALGHLGRTEEAHAPVAKLRELDPILRVSTLHNVLGPYRPEGLKRYQEGLRKAGLPE